MGVPELHGMGLRRGRAKAKSVISVGVDSTQGMELVPVPELDGQVVCEVSRFVPLPHAGCLVGSLYCVLRISVEPGFRGT